jgi:acetyl-CoA carboxylase carboxyl transferase subunit alpha
LTVSAKLRKGKKRDYPWPKDPDPNVKGGILRHLSPFKPLKEKPKPVTLDFEKPLKDIQKKLFDIQKMANETGLDFSDQIMTLENNYQKTLRTLYQRLTPIQRVQIARHPNRPTFLDHVFNITEKFVELHGDRAGYDDPAIVTGLGVMNGRTYMFIGHQKGRNTKENIKRNFGMPTPHGYRKALRMMYYADHHGFPIVTFIDTPGAFADLKCEELGQGEAIAHNLRAMFGLKVPVISIVIGEGGSGGALAIGCANKLIMLENAVFYVASPEACAAILWKSAKHAPRAAKKLRITAKELMKLKICDGIIPEPLGGAHTDPEWTSEQIKISVLKSMEKLDKMDIPALLKHRWAKHRQIGSYEDFPSQLPKVHYDCTDRMNPKISDKPNPDKFILPNQGLPKMVISDAKLLAECIPGLSDRVVTIGYKAIVADFEGAVLRECREAAITSGFYDEIRKLHEEYVEYKGVITPALHEKLNDLTSDFWQMICSSPAYESIAHKLRLLNDLSKNTRLKKTRGFTYGVFMKFSAILNRPEIKVKRDEVNSLIKEVGLMNLGSDNLDQNLKDKIDQLSNLLAIESNYLVPYHLLCVLMKTLPKERKEAGSIFKTYLEMYDWFMDRPDILEKRQELLSSDNPDQNIEAHINQQWMDALGVFYHDIGLRWLLKKIRKDKDTNELLKSIRVEFETILNRPDTKKKRAYVIKYGKKKCPPELQAKAKAVKQEVYMELGKVFQNLGLSKLLPKTLQAVKKKKTLKADVKVNTNGSLIKEQVAAVKSDEVKIVA